MAARDAFEWFVTTQLSDPSPAVAAAVRKHRAHLFTLRSEDERGRYVQWAMGELSRLARSATATAAAAVRPGRTGVRDV